MQLHMRVFDFPGVPYNKHNGSNTEKIWITIYPFFFLQFLLYERPMKRSIKLRNALIACSTKMNLRFLSATKAGTIESSTAWTHAPCTKSTLTMKTRNVKKKKKKIPRDTINWKKKIFSQILSVPHYVPPIATFNVVP